MPYSRVRCKLSSMFQLLFLWYKPPQTYDKTKQKRCIMFTYSVGQGFRKGKLVSATVSGLCWEDLKLQGDLTLEDGTPPKACYSRAWWSVLAIGWALSWRGWLERPHRALLCGCLGFRAGCLGFKSEHPKGTRQDGVSAFMI